MPSADPRNTNQSALSVPVFQVLLSLSDQSLHGYAILKDVEHRTGGEVVLAAGTLYAVLARLKKDGWITDVEGDATPDGDSRRNCYEITGAGAAALREEAWRLERSVHMAEVKGVIAARG